MDGLLFAGANSRPELVKYLDEEGYEVDIVETKGALRKYILESRPRMVIVTEEPLEYLTTLREVDKMLAVLVICPKNLSPEKEVEYLQVGADGLLSNDVCGEVLAAWVEALFRRLENCPFGQERYAFGDVEVDVFKRTVKKRSWRILMSATEFDLLVHLIRNNGKVVSREEILREVWKYDTCPTTRTVDNFICKLRRKIENTERKPVHLKTVKGTGYRFDLDADED